MHPNSSGYQRLAKQVHRFIVKKLPDAMRAKRPDSDGDGFSDAYEERYGQVIPPATVAAKK